MKLSAVAKVLAALFAAAALHAEDEVFLSLTRRSEPLSLLPTNASRLSAERLESLGAVTLDEGLWSTPSVLVQKSGTLGSFSTIRLRGSPSSAHQQILIDDLPLSGISSQFTDVGSQLSLTDVERVEILRGGSSILYGPSTMGGVVHVITKRPQGDRPLTRLRAEFRSFFTQVYEGDISGRSGGWDGYVSGGRALSDGFQKNQDADNIHATFKTGYSFGSGLRLSATGSVIGTKIGNPRGTLLPVSDWDGSREREALDPVGRVEQDTRRGTTGVFVPLGEDGHVQSTFYAFDQDYELLKSSNPSGDVQMENFYWGNDTRLVLAKDWTFGASYMWDGNHTGATVFDPSQDNHATNLGAYAQYDLALGSLRLIPALRRDEHSAFGAEWNPRLTAVLAPSDRLKYSVNAARSFRAPSFADLYFRSSFFNGNPNLRPETAWSYDAGVEYRPGHSSRLALTGFYTRIRERIAAPAPLFETLVNANHAEISGLELENEHRWLKRVTGQAVYTYTRALGNAIGRSRHVELARTPRHMGYYRLAWAPAHDWELASWVRYTAKQYQGDGRTGLDLPPYAVWSLRLSKKILAAEAYLAVDNILERRYALTFDNAPFSFATSRNPQPGRTFLAGIKMRFQD